MSEYQDTWEETVPGDIIGPDEEASAFALAERSELIEARATVNLPGLRAGETATVDPDLPYGRDLLERGYLIRETEG